MARPVSWSCACSSSPCALSDRAARASPIGLTPCAHDDDVFLGPHVVFTDDPHPQCPAYLDCVKGGVVRRRARIGANSTILPGVEIGEDALVGAGSVVRHTVPPRTVWAGNPAVQVKEDIRDLACFVGIYPHAYAWLKDLPERFKA